MLRQPLLIAALLSSVATLTVTAAAEENRTHDQSKAQRRENSALSDAAKDSAQEKDSGESRSVVPRNPRVLFITMKGCDRCARELARLRRPGGDFAGMLARGWKIGEGPENHLQIVDRDEIPDFVAELAIKEYPAVACISDREIVRSFKEGCTTPLDAWTFGWLLKGRNERPPGMIPEAARVETTGSYRLRGNHWSVDGDWNPPRATVISHLRSANHAGQMTASWNIESWSYEELRSLHDDLHEREGTYNPGVYAVESQSGGGGAGAGGFGASRKMLGR